MKNIPTLNLEWSKITQRISRRADELRRSGEIASLIAALMVGVAAAVGAIIFRWLIAYVSTLAFEGGAQAFSFLGSYYVIIIPMLGGLIIGPLIYFLARETKGHGVPEVMEAVALHGGRIRPIVAIVKALVSSICIGTGGSVGREGPIVQIGSAVGSTVGQVLRLSRDKIRNLVACGAAGGIAVTFNAPIAGVLFALEIILGEFTTTNFIPVVVSAVVASAIGRSVFGNTPAFDIPKYSVVSPWEFPLYALLGVAAAVIGLAFVVILYKTEDVFDSYKFPEYLKPAVGGLLIGLIGLFFPQIFGVGYEAMEKVLHSELPFLMVALLLLVKIFATSITLGSGGSGGVFAPSLFLGAMLGGAFGILVNFLFPAITAPSGAYALVGMAAVFSAAARAPITAVIILFEMTNDYRIILPLMLATVIATFLSEAIYEESVYSLKLRRRGVKIKLGHDVDLMDTIQISEIMTTTIDSVPDSIDLSSLVHEFERTHHHGFPVLDGEGKLWGIVSIGDLEQAMIKGNTDNLCARDIATVDLESVYPDQPMSVAIEKMAAQDLSRLPVVDRADPRKLLGVIRRGDLSKAYKVAAMRRTERSSRVS